MTAPAPLTVGEIVAIRAIIATHGPPQSRDHLTQRLTDQLPRFVTHHITCTDGCPSPDQCTQPGETPCPCHRTEEDS